MPSEQQSTKRARREDASDEKGKKKTKTSAAETTVRFNVGGQPFEVSRSLLVLDESTMLARLVSETWQDDPSATVFIDRDGEHFRHVLNYLRYGKVTLPLNVSKASFLQDMDYYGIEVAKGTVDFSVSNGLAVQRVAELQVQKDSTDVAYECMQQYFASGRGQKWMVVVFRNPDKSEELPKTTQDMYRSVKNCCGSKQLKECLAQYGFQLDPDGTGFNAHPERYYLAFTVIEP